MFSLVSSVLNNVSLRHKDLLYLSTLLVCGAANRDHDEIQGNEWILFVKHLRTVRKVIYRSNLLMLPLKTSNLEVPVNAGFD